MEEESRSPGAQAEATDFEEGPLGKYGLYFGNGYLIHGTLFQRFLGQSVTHGCAGGRRRRRDALHGRFGRHQDLCIY